MPRLSIVIACPNDAEPFETTLASVLQNRPVDCEVIVVHPFSYADPYELAGEVRFIDAGAKCDFLRLINTGLAAAQGEVVHLIESGLEVEDGWAEAALACFCDPRVATVSPLVVQRSNLQRVAWTGVGYSVGGTRRLCGAGQATGRQQDTGRGILGPTRMAAFYRASTLRELGGFDPEIGGDLADVDLALTLRELGYTCRFATNCRLRAGETPVKPAPSFVAGQQVERLFWRHAATHGWVASLLSHPLAVAAQSLAHLPKAGLLSQLAGRLVACFDPSAGRHYQRRLQRARATIQTKSEPIDETGQQASGDGRRLMGRQAA